MSALNQTEPPIVTSSPDPSPPLPRLPSAPPVVITPEDMSRLRAVVERYLEGQQGNAAELLESELDRARVVPQEDLPNDVVTMRSRVVFEVVETGDRREAVLVYPDEADLEQSKISVLAPVGMALLGLSPGQCISWPVPSARTRTLRLIEVLYQPEASGDLHL